MNTLVCPHCKKPVEISEALADQFKEQELEKITLAHKKELEAAKQEALASSAKKLEEQFALQLKRAKEDADEKDLRNKQLIEQMTDLTKELSKSKREKDEAKLEMQKQLLQEREQMQEELNKSFTEKANLENAELKKQLEDTKKALSEAQRKADQKSQQLQGEVLELNLEARLLEAFPNDEVLPVPKGIDGADISQKVRNSHNQTAGIILWELKRTKAWSNSWLPKLREDKRRLDANVAILVSEILPEHIKNFGFYENVWVTSYDYALPLANVLRMGLFELAVAKSMTANKDERMEALFGYLSRDGFRNRFEAQVESIITLKNDLDIEQRSTIRMWKKRESQIKKLMSSVASMYGELQGIMGQSLPSIQSLDTSMLSDGKGEQENLLE